LKCGHKNEIPLYIVIDISRSRYESSYMYIIDSQISKQSLYNEPNWNLYIFYT